jgi:hypothetical protein
MGKRLLREEHSWGVMECPNPSDEACWSWVSIQETHRPEGQR